MNGNFAARLLAHDAPRQAAVLRGSEILSYAELRQAVARAAGAWQELGVQPREPVVIGLEAGVAWTVAWLGAIWAGARAISLAPALADPEWQQLALREGWRFILVESRAQQPDGLRDFILTRGEWALAVCEATPVAAVPPSSQVASEGVTWAASLPPHPLVDVLVAGLARGATVRLDAACRNAPDSGRTVPLAAGARR